MHLRRRGGGLTAEAGWALCNLCDAHEGQGAWRFSVGPDEQQAKALTLPGFFVSADGRTVVQWWQRIEGDAAVFRPEVSRAGGQFLPSNTDPPFEGQGFGVPEDDGPSWRRGRLHLGAYAGVLVSVRLFAELTSADGTTSVSIDEVSVSANGGPPDAFDGGDACDNCPIYANPDQADTDEDGTGDACADGDDDGVIDLADNCPDGPNLDQADRNADREGDVCDDSDGDGMVDAEDNCPDVQSADTRDVDQDGLGDPCDDDIDGDEVPNENDVCPRVADPDQADSDLGLLLDFEQGDGGFFSNAPGRWARRVDIAGHSGIGTWSRVTDQVGDHALTGPIWQIGAEPSALRSWYRSDPGLPLRVELAVDGGVFRRITDDMGVVDDFEQFTVDLSAYSGRRAQVRFVCTKEGVELVRSLLLDDVELSVNGGPGGQPDGGDACDNCPMVSNVDQADDADGVGDACADDDGDELPAYEDNCPLLGGSDPLDVDENGIGDVCEN